MLRRPLSVFRALALAAVWPLLAASAASAGDAVLLSSTAPGYAPGMIVAANERLAVPEGASATLLFESGEMLRLRGPFDGPLRSPDTQGGRAASIKSWVESLRFQGVDAAVVGGTRSLVQPLRLRRFDQDLIVDPRRSATYCLDAATTVWIRRPDDGVDRVILRRRGTSRKIAWPTGATRVEWPADVLVENGDQYELVDAAGTAHATASFRVADDKTLSEAAWVARMALMGCADQASVALRELARTVSPRELWLVTDRGGQPTYRPGEPMRVMLQSNSDGFLYCVYRRGDETLVPIFPAGAVDGARLRGHEALSIPGQRRAGQLTAGSHGQARISCYLADRDISPELPLALLSDMAPVPENLASRLDTMFDSISGTRVLKASLEIKVE
jgi:hypothetical protein